MDAKFNLPGSSLEEVQKIVMGYGHSPNGAGLAALAKLTGQEATRISSNNKFLVDLGVISGGKVKSPTDLGKKLARALEHGQSEDARRFWMEAVQSNESLSGLVTTIRIRGGMGLKEFTEHVLYVSGQKPNSGNKTGAKCVVDLLVNAGLIVEDDGKIAVSTQRVEPVPVARVDEPLLPVSPLGSPPIASLGLGPTVNNHEDSLLPRIAINIELHLPATESGEVYDKLFKSLREHLLSRP